MGYLTHNLLLILTKHSSKRGVVLDEQSKTVACAAMMEYGARVINKYRSNERIRLLMASRSLVPIFRLEIYRLWLRKKFFRRAVREAELRAYTEGYKIYVIRSTELAYITLSTLEVNQKKRMRIFGKAVDAMELEKTSAYIAYPPPRHSLLSCARN